MPSGGREQEQHSLGSEAALVLELAEPASPHLYTSSMQPSLLSQTENSHLRHPTLLSHPSQTPPSDLMIAQDPKSLGGTCCALRSSQHQRGAAHRQRERARTPNLSRPHSLSSSTLNEPHC